MDPLGFEAGDYNLYRYVGNNPTNFTDSTGQIVDTLLDIGFIAYDIYVVVDHWGDECEDIKNDLLALGLDVAGALIPFATGLGAGSRLVVKGAGLIDDAGDAAKVVRKLDNADEFGRLLMRKLDDLGKGTGKTFDPEKLQRILANLETEGVTVFAGEEAERLLRQIGGSAAYLPTTGEPGILVLGKNPTEAAVVEELLHLGQHRKTGWADVTDRIVQLEIEAQEKLLRIGEHLGWSSDELAKVEAALGKWLGR